jgi:integrase
MEEQYIDIRNTQQTYENTVRRFKADGAISERNKEILLRFLRDAALGKTILGRAKKRIGPSRLTSYIHQITHLILLAGKDLDQITQEDMERFIEALESDGIRSRQVLLNGRDKASARLPLSNRYKVDIKITIKKFYKWLWGECKSYPAVVEWIETYCPRKEVPALTAAEVERMLDRCTTPRQHALIQVLFDGGVRIGELLNIRLHHVRLRGCDPAAPSTRCFVVRVPFSKTLRRTIALPMQTTTKWLSMWLEVHPAKPVIQPDGTLSCEDITVPLFPMTESAVRVIVARAGRKALGKRVYPHLLRHTSATYWSNKLPYFKFCKRFGWTMTSDMPQRYIDREGVDELEVAEIYNDQERARLARNNKHLQDQLAGMKTWADRG